MSTIKSSSEHLTLNADGASKDINLQANGSTKLTVKSDGDLLVGTTTSAGSIGTYDGFGALSNGTIFSAATDGRSIFSRRNSDGNIIEFRKDNSTVGSIGTRGSSSSIILLGAAGLTGSATGGGSLLPCTSSTGFVDNVVDFGYSSGRFDNIYATNGTIQTSDRHEKQDIEELTEAETRVAVACKSLMRKFRWKSAVAEKGDDARIHFGILAQDLQDAFTAEGLDAGRYGMFISSTWYEKETPVDAVEAVEGIEATYDDEGNELTPAVEAIEGKDAYIRTDTEDEPTEGYTERTRLGVRYPELLAFIISAL